MRGLVPLGVGELATVLLVPLYLAQASRILTQLLGLAVLAATFAAVAALVYRWYARETIPYELALLIGLGAVAVYLNTTTALGQTIGDETVAITEQRNVALFHLAAFAVAGGGALAGRNAGDRFGTDVLLRTKIKDVDAEVSRLVQTVGRVIVVELPEDVEDVVGYDPVSEATKAKLAGKRFVFPRNLTVEELHTRLVGRLKSDFGVGHVDLELAPDGSVEYLAVGSRAAGIGPTLPPATNAVAVRADPAFAASTGDLIQLWDDDPLRRVLTAELRGVADEVVTVAIDTSDTPAVDPRKQYRLVTLPVDDRPEREFASILRGADETFDSVTVEAGSPLHGMPVGALTVSVIGVHPEDANPAVLPPANYVLQPGDTLHAIALPERLRRLETAAEPLESARLSATTATDRSAADTTHSEPADQSDDTRQAAPVNKPSAETSSQTQPAQQKSGQSEPLEPTRQPEGAPGADDAAPASPSDADSRVGEPVAQEPDQPAADRTEPDLELDESDINFDDVGEDLSPLGSETDNTDEGKNLPPNENEYNSHEGTDGRDTPDDDGDEPSSGQDASQEQASKSDAGIQVDDSDVGDESDDGGKTFAELKDEYDTNEAVWASEDEE